MELNFYIRYMIQAKDYLKFRGFKNPPIDSGISGGGSGDRTYVSTIMAEYAEKYARNKFTELIEENAKLKSIIKNELNV